MDFWLEKVRAYCLRLPEVQEYLLVRWPAFRAGKRPFAIYDSASGQPDLSFRLSPLEQAEFLEQARFCLTPYLGQHGWTTVRCRDLEEGEMETLILHSYRKVALQRMLRALQEKTDS